MELSFDDPCQFNETERARFLVDFNSQSKQPQPSFGSYDFAKTKAQTALVSILSELKSVYTGKWTQSFVLPEASYTPQLLMCLHDQPKQECSALVGMGRTQWCRSNFLIKNIKVYYNIVPTSHFFLKDDTAISIPRQEPERFSIQSSTHLLPTQVLLERLDVIFRLFNDDFAVTAARISMLPHSHEEIMATQGTCISSVKSNCRT